LESAERNVPGEISIFPACNWNCTSQSAASTMRIGIISDTHGLMRPEATERLAGVHHIIHAGDIGRPEVISELRKIAPTTAIRGNIDRGEWAAEYPATALVKLGGRSIYVIHNLNELDRNPAAAGIGRIGTFASSENRDRGRRALPQSGKRGAAPFHPTHCTGDARADRRCPAVVHPRTWQEQKKKTGRAVTARGA
jgi:hypothetical protein